MVTNQVGQARRARGSNARQLSRSPIKVVSQVGNGTSYNHLDVFV
jgi:hypothetical protein